MRPIYFVLSSLLISASCSEQRANDDPDDKTAASQAAATATTESDYVVPKAEPGYDWFVNVGDGVSSAVYGPADAGGFAAITCNGSSVEVSLLEVDGRAGRETAMIRSGPASGSFKTGFDDGEMTALFADIPAGDPVIENIADFGLTISFSNGEKNEFPPSKKIADVVSDCVK